MKRILLLTILALLTTICQAAVPESRLFQFNRSKNKNYVCYDVNTKNGVLDMDEPVLSYWIDAETTGKRSELNFIQKKLAFGYKIVNKGKNEVTISLTAYSKLLIHIYKKGDKWIATTKLDGTEMIITKMFAQMHTPNSMFCDYVDIYGTSISTGEAIHKRIKNS